MEQIIVILVFAVCAAVCVRLFFASYTMTNESSDINNALLAAKNGAECYKAAGGDADKVAELLAGVSDGTSVAVYYDNNWQACQADSAAYVMSFSNDPDEPLINLSDISVAKITGEEIIDLTVAARRGIS